MACKSKAVSVPSRGLVFLILLSKVYCLKKQKLVSVPSRGLVFLIIKVPAYSTLKFKRFRPLAGISFFNRNEITALFDKYPGIGFRPLAGISFFNLIEIHQIHVLDYLSFRPLAGISFFNLVNA